MLLLAASFEPIFEPIMGVAARYNEPRDKLAAENEREDERRRAARNKPAMGFQAFSFARTFSCTSSVLHERLMC
jgi:hypothetical protein